MLGSVLMTNGGEFANCCINASSLCERGYSQPPWVLPFPEIHLPLWLFGMTRRHKLLMSSHPCMRIYKKLNCLFFPPGNVFSTMADKANQMRFISHYLLTCIYYNMYLSVHNYFSNELTEFNIPVCPQA